MSATFVREILYRVSTLLQDTQPQFSRWTERELVAWLNDGQRAIVRYVPIAGARVDVVRLVPGTRQSIAVIDTASVIPGDGSPSAPVHGLSLNEIVRNMGSDGRTPGIPVSIVSRHDLDAVLRMWHSARGARVIEHFSYDPRTPQTFYVYPPVGDTPVWVEANYVAHPKQIPSGSYGYDGYDMTTTSIDSRWDDDLVNYIMARAWMKDAEHAANAANVQLYTSLFTNSISAQVQALTGQNPNLSVLPLAPDIPAAAS